MPAALVREWCVLLFRLFAVALVAGFAGTLNAQGTPPSKLVTLVIRDAANGRPMRGAELVGEDGVLIARADSSGVMEVRVTTATVVRGRVRVVGFAPSPLIVTDRSSTDSVVVLLESLPAQALAPVRVHTERAVVRYGDFDRRRLSGGPGIFVTDSAIARRGHARVIDVFRWYPSLYVTDSMGIQLVTSRRAQKPIIRGKNLDLAPCVFQVVVDDVRMEWGFALNDLNVRDIHGIEVYPGPASVPPAYKSSSRDSACGLIAIWTKSR